MALFSKDTASNYSVSDSDFDDQLTVGGAGVSEKINRYECATPEAAAALQAHLVSIGLNQFVPAVDWPFGKFVVNSPFAQSAKVPYLNFPRVPTPDDATDNLHVNVAHILVDYTRYPLKFADALVINKYGPAQ
jgi:hypothetical protein